MLLHCMFIYLSCVILFGGVTLKSISGFQFPLKVSVWQGWCWQGPGKSWQCRCFSWSIVTWVGRCWFCSTIVSLLGIDGWVLGWILYGRFWEHFSASSLSRARANISQDLGCLRQRVFSLFSTLNSNLHSISSLFVWATVVDPICNAHSSTCM